MKNLDGNQEALKKRVTIKHQHSFANLKNNNCFCSTKANTCKDKLIKVFVEKKNRLTCYKNSGCSRNGAKKNLKKVAISKESVLVFVEVFVV